MSMKNCPFMNFLAKNWKMSVIGLFAVVICFLYYLTWDCEELFHNAGVLFEMIYAISISYIVSLIFYFLQVYLPNHKKEDAQRNFLDYQVREIISLMDKPFKELLNESDEKVYELANITETEFNSIDIYKNLKKPANINRYHRQITVQEYIEECVNMIDNILKELLVQYVGIMDSTEYSLYMKIYQSEYHRFIRNNILDPPGSFRPLKENTLHTSYGGYTIVSWEFKMISEYQSLYSELTELNRKRRVY